MSEDKTPYGTNSNNPENEDFKQTPESMNAETPNLPESENSWNSQSPDELWINGKIQALRQEIKKTIVGQEEVIALMLAGVLCNGHVLLEGVPGVAKTLSAKSLSKLMSVDFSRIQFTPDLMPSDVIGTSIFNQKTAEFNFRKGPIFSNIVLIDEINRAPAKTQAALFEVMEERQITYDGTRYELEFPFLIVATQNPVEQEGTYNLPEAQLDRFLFKVKLGYPELDQEIKILENFKGNLGGPNIASLNAIVTPEDLRRAQKLVENVVVEERLLNYIAQLVLKTRRHSRIYLGGSPRASINVLKSARAFAVIEGRGFVTPEDIKYVFPHVLNHRIILTPEAEMEGMNSEMVIKDILATVEIPR